MNAYMALIFCSKADLRSYGREVSDTIASLAGTRVKRSESTEHVVAVAFATSRPRTDVVKAFKDLWRPEQRTWVMPLEDPVLIDKSIMDWAKRQVG